MRFEEANELFGTETLQNMTMAQVNGGFAWAPVVAILNPAVGIVVGVVTIVYLGSLLYDRWTEGDEPTADFRQFKPELSELTFTGDTVIFRGHNISIDSARYNSSEDRYEISLYGINFWEPGGGPTVQ